MVMDDGSMVYLAGIEHHGSNPVFRVFSDSERALVWTGEQWAWMMEGRLEDTYEENLAGWHEDWLMYVTWDGNDDKAWVKRVTMDRRG